jgi:hypothetical protein
VVKPRLLGGFADLLKADRDGRSAPRLLWRRARIPEPDLPEHARRKMANRLLTGICRVATGPPSRFINLLVTTLGAE